MRQFDADLRRQADMAQRMSASRAGAAIEAGNGDDVSTRLRHANGDRADAWNDRDLDRDASVRVGRLHFVDHLCEVFDRIDVMVVRR